MALALGMVTIVVPDYDAAIEWFTTKLGFGLIEDTVVSASKRWVVVGPENGLRILLAVGTDERQRAAIGNQTGGRVSFFLHTNDFHADHAEMLARGVVFAEQPRKEAYGWVCVFIDGFGNRWDLLETALA